MGLCVSWYLLGALAWVFAMDLPYHKEGMFSLPELLSRIHLVLLYLLYYGGFLPISKKSMSV